MAPVIVAWIDAVQKRKCW